MLSLPLSLSLSHHILLLEDSSRFARGCPKLVIRYRKSSVPEGRSIERASDRLDDDYYGATLSRHLLTR